MNNHHKPTQISAEFKQELENELEHLRNHVRPMIAERLKSAREGGDITDNAAFEQAKEDLARLMGKMAEIEKTLREATVIHHNGNGKPRKVEIGTIVSVSRDDGRECSYKIVESMEASPNDGKVSDQSPIGRALVGRKRGDTVQVEAPARTISYTITDIQFIH
ncbi:MAG TPA: GreA/GreB family elongation factor [Chloroflexota bacterium]|nr:GreA/GreB family elongation factor [Chloroflexota bacterium]